MGLVQWRYYQTSYLSATTVSSTTTLQNCCSRQSHLGRLIDFARTRGARPTGYSIPYAIAVGQDESLLLVYDEVVAVAIDATPTLQTVGYYGKVSSCDTRQRHYYSL